MKKILTILLVSFSVAATAQVKHLYDTLNGNEVVNFGTIYATGDYSSLSLDIECTELGGTSDGTLVLQGRNGSDATFETLGEFEHGQLLKMTDTDSVFTITDGATWKINLVPPTYREYRIQGDGTSSDTTRVDIYYTFKKY